MAHAFVKMEQAKLRAMQIQLITIPTGVLVKRGCAEVMITGANAAEAVKKVFAVTGGKGASLRDIRRCLHPASRSEVDTVVRKLLERRLLVWAEDKERQDCPRETPFDVFAWTCGDESEVVLQRLNRIRIVILGINAISVRLAAALVACGYEKLRVINHQFLPNGTFIESKRSVNRNEWPASLPQPESWDEHSLNLEADCLVATSDCGGQRAFCQWNKLCLDRQIHFMPVMLKNLIGYVGPVVVPGETACYECVVSRQRAHMANPDVEQISDDLAFEGREVSAFHPSMVTILGDIAAFELTKLYGLSLQPSAVSRFLEVNLLRGTMTGRAVVKMPRCPACSHLHKAGLPDLGRALFGAEHDVR